MIESVKEQKNSPNFQANLVRGGIFLFVALGLALGTFYFEENVSSVSLDQKNSSSAVVLDYSKENVLPDSTVLRFVSDEEHDVNFESARDGSNFYNVKYGHLWANFQSSSGKNNIRIGDLVLIPDHCVFDLKFYGEKLNLAVYKGDLYVGFLPEKYKLNQFIDQYSDVFLNRLLIPQDTQAAISVKKVNVEMVSLLPAKLMKEVKYAAIPASEKLSDWVKINSVADKKLTDLKRREMVSRIIADGLVVNNGFFANILSFTQQSFTFIPEKKEKMLYENLFSHLDNAIFYANEGNDFELKASLASFEDELFSIDLNVINSEEFESFLDSYIRDLSVFGPQDKQYEVLKFLLNQKFIQTEGGFEVVSAFWLDVYRGIAENKIVAEKALNQYYDYFDKVVSKKIDQQGKAVFIAYQNQLFDNLLLRYPIFYKDSYFAIKNAFEQNLLGIYEDGRLKDEVKQSLVSTKIDFMKRLRKFFFDGELDVATSKEIFSRLFEEIDALMPKEDDSGVAVIKLFESQLADADDFWGYLNSPEYHTGTYGGNSEERFKNYLKEREEIWDFINIKKEVLGETVTEENDTLDVVAEIEEVLKSDPVLTDLEIGAIESVGQRNVEVKGVIGGYPFEAQYDRDAESLKEVYAYGELVSDRAIKVGSLLKILQEKFANLADTKEQDLEPEEITLETSAERYARLYIAKVVSEYGFVVEIENVSIVNEKEAVYRVKNVSLEKNKDVVVTFDMLMNGERIRNVFLEINNQSRVVEGEFSLQEFTDLIYAENDFSVGENVKESARVKR